MANQLTPKENRGLFTRRALAEAFSVHMQTVTGWEQEGMPVETRGSRGRPSMYRLADCLEWRIQRELAARGVGETGVLDPIQEKALLDSKRREELEMKIAVRRGELVSVADEARRNADVATAVKARLRGIPDAIADQVATAARLGPAVVKALLLDKIDDALRELAALADRAPVAPTDATSDDDELELSEDEAEEIDGGGARP